MPQHAAREPDVFFPQLSNDVDSFSKFSIFTFKKNKKCYISKIIFLIFLLPSRSKAEHFLRRKGYFPKSARDVFCEK